MRSILGRLAGFAPPSSPGGSECGAFWGGCLERRNIRQSQITPHPNNPTRTTPFGPSDLPKSCYAAGRLQDLPHPPLWEGQNAEHSGEGAWSGEKLARVKSLRTPTTPPGRRPSARPTSPKAATQRGGCRICPTRTTPFGPSDLPESCYAAGRLARR
jgi:hypothetical protein